MVTLCLVTTMPVINAQTAGFFTEYAESQFSFTPAQQEGLDSIKQAKYTQQIRLVTVNELSELEYLGNFEMVIPGYAPDTFKIETQTFDYRSSQDYTWAGNFTNANGTAIIIVKPEGKAGTIQIDTSFFSIQPVNDTLSVLVRHHKTTQPDFCGGETGGSASPPEPDWCSEEFNTCPAEIDILLIWTPQALNYPGYSNIFIASFAIAFAEASVNTAFANSDIPNKSVKIVKGITYDPDYLDGQDIFSDAQDAAVDETLQNYREEYRADIVVMLTNQGYSGATGQSLNNEFVVAENAYILLEVFELLTPTYTFAHEIGHAFGALHESGTHPGGSQVQRCANTDTHAHSFITSGIEYGTVVHTSPPNVDATILHYSNPQISYSDAASGSTFATGTAVSDNSRAIRNSGCIVAGFVPRINWSVGITGPGDFCDDDGDPLSTIRLDARVVAGSSDGFGFAPFTYEWAWSQSVFNIIPGNPLGQGTYIVISKLATPFFFVRLTVNSSDGYSKTVIKKIITTGCVTSPGGGSSRLIMPGKPKDLDLNGDLTVFPNPNDGRMDIALQLEAKQRTYIKVVDISGKEVLASDLGLLDKGLHKRTIILNSLPNGLYWLVWDVGKEKKAIRFTLQKP